MFPGTQRVAGRRAFGRLLWPCTALAPLLSQPASPRADPASRTRRCLSGCRHTDCVGGVPRSHSGSSEECGTLMSCFHICRQPLTFFRRLGKVTEMRYFGGQERQNNTRGLPAEASVAGASGVRNSESASELGGWCLGMGTTLARWQAAPRSSDRRLGLSCRKWGVGGNSSCRGRLYPFSAGLD